jgi:hypothetical protein
VEGSALRRVAPSDGRDRSVRVVPVAGRRLLRDFIRLPWSLYVDDLAWIPPLRLERRLHLARRRPYFAHADARFWVAYRGTLPVGRVSAQVDRLHLEHQGDRTGFFGMLEAEDDAGTFEALFAAAEAWLRGRGLGTVRGPFNLSINEECGLLVDGFDSPPMVMMPHGRPYYAARVEECGYAPAKDLLAYRVASDFAVPQIMRAVTARYQPHARIRPLRRSRFQEELGTLRDIFEDAWSENWSFIPFTTAEFAELGWVLRFVVADGFVQIAEVDGAPAAMLVLLPDVNELLGGLNGRLLPLGWLKLLWRLAARRPRRGRVALMGVRKRHQRTPLGMALAFMLIDAVRVQCRARGMQEVELSWILEDNVSMRHIVTAIGSVPYKRYRIYEKALV